MYNPRKRKRAFQKKVENVPAFAELDSYPLILVAFAIGILHKVNTDKDKNFI